MRFWQQLPKTIADDEKAEISASATTSAFGDPFQRGYSRGRGARCLWHGVEQPQTAINSTLLRDCHFDHFSNAFPPPSWHLTLDLIHNFLLFFFFFFVSLAAPRLFISSRFCSLRRRKYISTCHPCQSTGRGGAVEKKIIIIIQIIILARASHNSIQQTAHDKSEEVSLQVAVKSEREKKNYCKKTDGGDTKAQKVQRKQCMYIDAHTFIHI